MPEANASTVEVVGLDRRQLLVRHVKGDTHAFAELVTMYRSSIYSYLRRSGLDPSTSDDLFQEIFLKVHRGAKSYNPQKKLDPWVFTIVANTVRSHFRKKRVRLFLRSHSETEMEHPASTTPSAHEANVARETAAWLESVIQHLPEKQREVLLLSRIKGLEHQEIAKVLSMPVATIKTHLRRARLSLAKSLRARKARLEREVHS